MIPGLDVVREKKGKEEIEDYEVKLKNKKIKTYVSLTYCSGDKRVCWQLDLHNTELCYYEFIPSSGNMSPDAVSTSMFYVSFLQREQAICICSMSVPI